MTYDYGLETTWSLKRIVEADSLKSDTVDLPFSATAIYVDVAGTLAVLDAYGNATSYAGLTPGMWHPMSVARIKSTGTTATGLKIGAPR